MSATKVMGGGDRESNALLKIIIAGAGISGMATAITCALAGHSVIIVESAKEISEIGAGLQVTPNATRLLQSWGLPDSLWDSAAEPTTLSVHRYSDGKTLAFEDDFNQKIRTKYGAPFLDMHRADLQLALFARATDLGVQFVLGEKVVSVEFQTPSITTDLGNSYVGDLVVGADGLWSRCRKEFEGVDVDPEPTGDLAYRILLDLKDIEDPELRESIGKPRVRFWIGPNAHTVSYSLKGGNMYNVVLLVPDDLPPNVSRMRGSVDEMKALFANWDPVLSSILAHAKSVDKWKLMHRPEMESWVHPNSTFVMIGDACHPMLPYLAQGANSSIEDGAVLGGLLGKITAKTQLPQALAKFQQLRKARGEAIVRETFKQRYDFHLVDGAEQEARDQLMLGQLGKDLKGPFPSRWTCPEVQSWIYGYDAVKEVEQAVIKEPFI